MDRLIGDATFGRGLDRKDFLKLAGAAGLGAAAGASVLPGAAGAAVNTNLDPTDFQFTIRERFRPFNLLAENFVGLSDGFGTDSGGDYDALAPGGSGAGDVEIGGGSARFSGDGYTVLRSDTGQEAPYATVIVEVEAFPGGAVYAGLYERDQAAPDDGDYVQAYCEKDNPSDGAITVVLEARVDGQTYELGSMEAEEQGLFDAPFRFAFVANENEVTALVSDRASDIGDFRPLIKRDVRFETGDTLDLRLVTVLETFKNGFGARTSGDDVIVFDRVRAGYFGEAGVRDPHVVQYANGAPYIKNNRLYFTLTNAGLGFFEKAHWAVWAMDLSDYAKIEQVANIFWKNDGDETKVFGHHAGQIVVDEAEDRWIVLISSWGDFGPQGGDQGNFGTVTYPDQAPTFEPPVDILYTEIEDISSTNLLKGVHVLTGAKHPINSVPFPTEGKWDPGLTRIDGRWYLAYVIALDLFSDFQPALARSPEGGDHLDVTEFVGADWGKRATEGPILQKLGGQWRLLASCGDDEPPQFQGRYPMYFLRAEDESVEPDDRPAAEAGEGRTLAFDGYLHAPHPSNIPHPMVVPVPEGRKTKYAMISFNGIQYYEPLLGYGTHGDFYVMQARQTVRGREFGRR